MGVSFTVLIGCLGRPTLVDTLRSCARQAWAPGDQVCVVVDTSAQGHRPDVVQLVQTCGAGFHVDEFGLRGGAYGTPQINHALEHFPQTGSHLLTLGDDDVYVDGAWATIRRHLEAAPAVPLLWRFVAPWRAVLWPRPVFEIEKISGCCIAAPREFAPAMPERKQGRPYPEHDYDWMRAIIRAAGRVRWLDEILVIARPPIIRGRTVHAPVVRCPNCDFFTWREAGSHLAAPYCPSCRGVLPLTDWPRGVVADTEAA